jgi:hypothetical protein
MPEEPKSGQPAPTGRAPEGSSSEGSPSEEAPSEEAPSEEAPSEEAPPEEAPPEEAPPDVPSLGAAGPRAVAVLTSLRWADPRLILSAREAARLAPAVARWLDAGVEAPEVTTLLTTRLPDHFLARPASILAYRLRETPLPAGPPSGNATSLPVLPFQTCDGCERAFRAPAPGRCKDCPPAEHLRATG